MVTISNSGEGSIATANRKFACSILSLEKKSQTGWKNIDSCGSAAVTTSVVIEGSKQKVIEIPTTAAFINDLTPGTYRLVFTFVAGREAIFPPDETKEIKTVYSAQFQIR